MQVSLAISTIIWPAITIHDRRTFLIVVMIGGLQMVFAIFSTYLAIQSLPVSSSKSKRILCWTCATFLAILLFGLTSVVGWLNDGSQYASNSQVKVIQDKLDKANRENGQVQAKLDANNRFLSDFAEKFKQQFAISQKSANFESNGQKAATLQGFKCLESILDGFRYNTDPSANQINSTAPQSLQNSTYMN